MQQRQSIFAERLAIATDELVTRAIHKHEAHYHARSQRRAVIYWLASCLVAALGLAGAAISEGRIGEVLP